MSVEINFNPYQYDVDATTSPSGTGKIEITCKACKVPIAAHIAPLRMQMVITDIAEHDQEAHA